MVIYSNINLIDWIIGQIKGLIFVQVIIIVLMVFLEFLKVIGIERLIHYFLSPFLKIIGIGKDAMSYKVILFLVGIITFGRI